MNRRFTAATKPALFALVALMSWGATGCASDESRREQERLAGRARYAPVQEAKYTDDGSSQEMTVSGEEGTLNSSDVDNALKAHFGEIRDCYRLFRRGARAGTRVVMRFFVDAKGEVQDVSIIESTVGNHALERCIADIGLGVMFEPPAGHKATTFDYPVEFRPSRQVAANRQHGP